MEREFKWTASLADFDRLRAALPLRGGPAVTDMQATYFDTPDHLLRARRIALRLRRENGVSVCCMKLRGVDALDGLHAHAEYECPADTLADGLSRLPAQGADAALCAALAQGTLVPICHTAFLRTAYTVAAPAFTAELAFDTGTLAAGARQIPFSEIECEFKSGDPAAFDAAGAQWAREMGLIPQPLSKLARALQLSKSEN